MISVFGHYGEGSNDSSHRIGNVISILIVALLILLVMQSLMLRTSTETVLLGVLAGLMAVVVMQSNQWSSGRSVEYKTVPADALNYSTLQQCGKEGWRLVCTDTAGAGHIFTR